MQVFDFLELAITNLQHRKLRSWLTMIGIFIGIAAVVSLISLGKGMQQAITKQFEEAGSNIITIMGASGGMASPVLASISAKPITVKDKKKVEHVQGVDQVAGILVTTALVSFKGEEKSLMLWGMDPGPTKEIVRKSQNYEIAKGRELEEGDKAKAVLGFEVANNLFRRKVKVGDKILINNKPFTVVGIVERVGNKLDDEAVIIPLQTLRDLINEQEKYSMLLLTVKQGYDPEIVAEKIRETLRKFRDEEEGSETFQVSTPKDLLKVFNSILTIVQVVLVGIAAISLLVGGIGIMNTMYMAVLERTKEIGVMKAIGAKDSHILTIFLAESGLLGAVGGLIGVVIGLSISKSVEVIVKAVTGTQWIVAYVSWWLILFAIAFSFIVGVISGLLPARQAAMLNPADALRYE
ncbi:ABC transporter permease [Candidatus Woesearchaeota archaeon]|nr:ABC transporter permease [Candidatus Woesearchaeota archaeon]